MEERAQTTTILDPAALEEALVTLNRRFTSRALDLWRGRKPPASQHRLYDDLSPMLNASAINRVRANNTPVKGQQRIFHALLGHYLQYRLSPYENELFTWMKGAAAHVNGEKIYVKDILSWCQKQSDLETRRILEKESSSLCKFLKPFALGFWEHLLHLLREEFGYESYQAYCRDKKKMDYHAHASTLGPLLDQTEDLYFEAMEAWARTSLGVRLSDLNRYDGIYLLGLGEFDSLYPKDVSLKAHMGFFRRWGMGVDHMPGVHLHLSRSPEKGAQAMSFALEIPHDIHMVMNPQGGWIDLETLFHELGHVFGHAFTSPDIPLTDKDLFTSNILSETYAFLLQNMCFSPAFLERQLGLSPRSVEKMTYYKTLKDLSVFRRYAAKFLAEYEMFENGDIESGKAYERLLKKYTGFSYRPETHLFDLVPEFYSLDYVVSWMAEATLERALQERLGHDWMLQPETGELLQSWWAWGNRYEVDPFFALQGIGPIDPRDIETRWRQRLEAGAP